MNKYEHIIVPETIKKAIKYSPRHSGGGGLSIPMRNRQEHAEYLQNRFDAARAEDANVKQQMTAISLPARSGTYIEFAGTPAYDLVSKSLEDQKAGIRLLNIRQIKTEDSQEQSFATIYIPHGKENKLLEKLHKYATEEYNGKPKNDALFRSIENINIALLKALWTDKREEFPTDRNDWYEVWIRISAAEDIETQQNKFIDSLRSLDIRFKEDSILTFPERSVFLVYANKDSLTKLLGCSDQLAELRSGRVLTGFLFDEYRG